MKINGIPEVVVDTILRTNGWHPDRNVKCDIMKEELKALKYIIHDKADKFLNEYYGLCISQTYQPGANSLSDRFLRLGASPKHKALEGFLCKWTLGFGVNQKGNEISYRFETEQLGDQRKSIEQRCGTQICMIGQEYYQAKSVSIKRGCFFGLVFKKRRSNTLVAGEVGNSGPNSTIFMIDDGRLLLANLHNSSGEIYKNIQELLFTYYCKSSGYIQMWNDSCIEIEYVDF